MAVDAAVWLSIASGVAFMAWAVDRWRRGPESTSPPLPPELHGRLLEMQVRADETGLELARHGLADVMSGSAGQLAALIANARHLAEEQARLRAWLRTNPRKGAEHEVERRREKAGGPPGGPANDRLARAERYLALVVAVEAELEALRGRFLAIDETIRLIHAQAVAAGADGPPVLDVDRVARDLEASAAALAEVQALHARRRATPALHDR